MTKRKPKNVASEVPKKVPKRAKNHRTRSNPFEKADEEEYIVREIDGPMHSKERGGWCYYTYWENFTDAEATWEPGELRAASVSLQGEEEAGGEARFRKSRAKRYRFMIACENL